jgi:hypothetical protein
MVSLILKRASASRPSSQWSDEDYDVLADGNVGRIYEDASTSAPPELGWFWSVTAIVPAIPSRTNGHASTLDEAKAKFRGRPDASSRSARGLGVPLLHKSS